MIQIKKNKIINFFRDYPKVQIDVFHLTFLSTGISIQLYIVARFSSVRLRSIIVGGKKQGGLRLENRPQLQTQICPCKYLMQ
jgi:hypothetical protein